VERGLGISQHRAFGFETIPRILISALVGKLWRSFVSRHCATGIAGKVEVESETGPIVLEIGVRFLGTVFEGERVDLSRNAWRIDGMRSTGGVYLRSSNPL
jgi:hypothetical protein